MVLPRYILRKSIIFSPSLSHASETNRDGVFERLLKLWGNFWGILHQNSALYLHIKYIRYTEYQYIMRIFLCPFFFFFLKMSFCEGSQGICLLKVCDKGLGFSGRMQQKVWARGFYVHLDPSKCSDTKLTRRSRSLPWARSAVWYSYS